MDSATASKQSLLTVNRLPLFQEYRLIEKPEDEINGAWKGAHLLLFFLAFVFGSFCTFCFHMLMYLFDEKCVLFPKLMSLTSLKNNIIYELIPSIEENKDLPVDFLSTQWVEKSTCSLPTYVPLVSGIFGLVWTTMFLMCSTGSRTLTGLQRTWRVLPPVFVFSLAMGCLCVHSSVITHTGLEELCRKLGEITGSGTCTYTVNVATLTYERRIRGVYQATRLTIIAAWLHTACWLMSALLTLIRVLLAVDFLLVRVSAELHGDIDKIMEKNEVQLRNVSPQTWVNIESECASLRMFTEITDEDLNAFSELMDEGGDLIYLSNRKLESSEPSLVPDEEKKIALKEALTRIPKDKAFIVRWLYDLVDKLKLPNLPDAKFEELVGSTTKKDGSTNYTSEDSQARIIKRQFGQADISIFPDELDEVRSFPTKADSIILNKAKKKKGGSIQFMDRSSPKASTSKRPDLDDDSQMKETSQLQRNIYNSECLKKSILKTVGVQTDIGTDRKPSYRVQISKKNVVRIRSSDDDVEKDETPKTAEEKEVDKETQTKEKQD